MTSASDVVGTRPEWSIERATEVVQAHCGGRGPLLPVLHALQDEFGYIDPAAVPLVAGLLNLSRADVHGVVTFYRDFRTTPPAPVHVQVCRAEACQSVGAHGWRSTPCRALGIDVRRHHRGRLGRRSTRSSASATARSARRPSSTARLHGRVDADRLDDAGRRRSCRRAPA